MKTTLGKTVDAKFTTISLATLFSAGLLLVGCATNPADCDPHGDGFIGGLAALTSGCYDQRIAIKQTELSSSQSLTQQLRKENQELQAEKAQTSSQLRTAERQLAALQSSNTQLGRDLQRLQAGTTAKKQEKLRLQHEFRQINREISDLKQRATKGTISEEALRQEIRRLTRERDELASAIADAEALR